MGTNMPINKNALLRHQIIDSCLRNRGRKWTWKNILDRINEEIFKLYPQNCGISKTTLYEDLKDIEYRIYKLEIEKVKEGRTIYLRYLNANDSITKTPLNEVEISQLKAAISIISRFKGLPQFDWLYEIIPILESKLGLLDVKKEIISFDSNIDYLGGKHIPTLLNAILNKRVLLLSYQNFKSRSGFEIEVHPQYLKQYNSRWYLMSFSNEWGDKPQTHALDRITNIHEVQTKYCEQPNFDWDEYFSDIIGVTKYSKDPIEVKLLIMDEEQASYIETNPLHQSQKKLKKVNNGFITSISIIPNYELEKIILSFGERIKVISPQSLVDTIKLRISKMTVNYC